jgi:hypothetical protein
MVLSPFDSNGDRRVRKERPRPGVSEVHHAIGGLTFERNGDVRLGLVDSSNTKLMRLMELERLIVDADPVSPLLALE